MNTETITEVVKPCPAADKIATAWLARRKAYSDYRKTRDKAFEVFTEAQKVFAAARAEAKANDKEN